LSTIRDPDRGTNRLDLVGVLLRPHRPQLVRHVDEPHAVLDERRRHVAGQRRRLHRELLRPRDRVQGARPRGSGAIHVLDREPGKRQDLDVVGGARGVVLTRDRENRSVRLQDDESGRGERERAELDLGHEARQPRHRRQVRGQKGPAGRDAARALSAVSVGHEAWLPSFVTALRSVPIPSISISTSSPSVSAIGGLRKMPTPAGVPVRITSPGRRVKTVET
jgi:hypothetical protein